MSPYPRRLPCRGRIERIVAGPQVQHAVRHLPCLLILALHSFALVTPSVHASHSAGRVGTAGAPGTISIRARGVQVTVTVPHNSYPRNALVSVTIDVRNITNRSLGVMTADPYQGINGTSMLQAEVVARDGTILFPPAMLGGAPNAGPPPVAIPLEPGKDMRRTMEVILRASGVRASVGVTKKPYVHSPAPRVVTPVLHLTLTKPDPPRAILQGSTFDPTHPLSVVITPRRPLGSRMQYMELQQCYYPNPSIPEAFEGDLRWTTTSNVTTALHLQGSRVQLTPFCPPDFGAGSATPVTGRLMQVHIVAGWRNHSVVYFDYPRAWIDPRATEP